LQPNKFLSLDNFPLRFYNNPASAERTERKGAGGAFSRARTGGRTMSLEANFFAEMEAKIPRGRVRTRFAPSPTGYMHVGNLRTALYAYLIARRAGGTFLLRIEDTDQGRYVEGALRAIYDTLKACGLSHTTGPDVGGPVGPYIQTQRREIYGKYAQLLIEKGGAYRCFCDEKRLASLRERGGPGAGKYDGHCANLSQQEIDEKIAAGVPFVIRQKIPRSGSTTFSDAVFGDITVPNADLDDNVLIKSDGLPTYNFANVIDDHLMGITHVVRGSEYLSSAPKYNLLYQAFGWDIPVYVHCSPVMRDAHNKMSKRHGDPSYEDLIAQGYLSDAVVNYVALLGWSPGGEREIFSLSELAEIFDIKGISKSPAIFDIEKLNYFNSTYLKALPPEAYHEAAKPKIRQVEPNPAMIRGSSRLCCKRFNRLNEIPALWIFLKNCPHTIRSVRA
jgi:glutamyl-tRNA synthetase